jgi:hypothetical protein
MSGDYTIRREPIGWGWPIVVAKQNLYPWTVTCDCGYRKPISQWKATQEVSTHVHHHQLAKLLAWNLR